MINNLLKKNVSNEIIYQWLKKYDNTIFTIVGNLKLIERNDAFC